MEQERGGGFSHGLKYDWLTAIYDPVVRLTCRETRCKTGLIRQARMVPGRRALDLACGTGTLTVMIKKSNPSAEVTGLDGSDRILDIARKKAAAARVDIGFTHALSQEMPYQDCSFEYVFSSFFFHHLGPAEKMRTLEEVHRVLVPGGELHVADWGKPPNTFFRLAFGLVQLLDGFETTRDSVTGMLPEYMKRAEFEQVLEKETVLTPLGSVSLYVATRPSPGA